MSCMDKKPFFFRVYARILNKGLPNTFFTAKTLTSFYTLIFFNKKIIAIKSMK